MVHRLVSAGQLVLNRPASESRLFQIGKDSFPSARKEPPDEAHEQEATELAHLQRR